YVIAINGAQVYDIRNDRTVCASELTWQRAVDVLAYLDTLPVIYDCYQDGWGWMTQSLYDRAAEFAANPHSLDMILRLRTPVPELKEYLAEKQHGVQKIQAFFKDMELRSREIDALQKRFPDTTVTTSIVNNVEINSKDATKGVAIQKLAAYLGLELSQTMAFGDDTNDVTMLRAAGIGVAMGNAADAVKAAADFVTDDCNHSGVAKAIRRFLREEKS
ncbi:MAG: HAD family phosphatase, partial [Oscillospiraceae bacterium]|nr:HAD family phosphatase [Oscillospiraceae bacterium]